MAFFRNLSIVLALQLSLWQACAASDIKPKDGDSSSPQWLSYDDTIFERARQEKKLVLLDLEAVWCHWCHVMDHETYGDSEVQKILKDGYLVVKVDQDKNPLLSGKYEDYGWPATIIFDSSGRELVKKRGYIKPEKMRAMLEGFRRDPTPVGDGHSEAEDVLSKDAVGPKGTEAGYSPAVYQALLTKHKNGYDTKNGGWGFGQKFLDWDSVEYSMLKAAKVNDPSFDKRAKQTLDAQLNLLDPAFGGVYQYSTDGDWKHPHFEKIMQMQAENMRIYALAAKVYKNPKYLAAAKSIAAYLQDFLRSQDGVFYTSQDADLVQGKHSADYFKLDRAGRLKLGQPIVDKHVYARENGWAITALANLYAASGDRVYLDMACRALSAIEKSHSSKGGFSHEAIAISPMAAPGGAAGSFYLADNLAMARAYLALYAATGGRDYLAKASKLADFIDSHFRAAAGDGYVNADSSAEASKVLKPVALLDDNVMLARFSNLLYRYTGEVRFGNMNRRCLAYLGTKEAVNKRQILTAGILLAVEESQSEPFHITVVGAKSDAEAAKLFSFASQLPLTYLRLEWFDKREGPLPGASLELPELERPAAFICSGGTCSRPSFDQSSLLKAFEKLKSNK
jgi:uncharacterized protein YyaL (SSP411 family)